MPDIETQQPSARSPNGARSVLTLERWWVTVPQVGDRDQAARLGPYMIPCPLVLERLTPDEGTGEVLYWARPSRAAHPEGPVARWDVFAFIARVLDHLPPPRQQLVRYWGYYSNVSRGKRRAAARHLAQS